MRAKTLPNSSYDKTLLYIRRSIEGLWLAAAFLIPLAIAPSDWMISYIQLPKVALLRVLVSLVAMLWVVEWALSARDDGLAMPRVGWRPFQGWVVKEPTRWLLVAVTVFMGVYLLSTVLSASVRTSVWGSPRIWDGYSLYNMLTCYLLFMVIVTHLKSREQLWRLLGAVAAAAGVASLLGLLERLRWIPLRSAVADEQRIESTFGNPIFFGAFLVMAIPLTLGLALALNQKAGRKLHLAGWVPLVALQMLALAMTISRGPLVGLAAGLTVFFVLGVLVLDIRTLGKAGLLVGAAAAIAVISLRVIPDRLESPSPKPVSQVVEERLFRSYPDVASGGLSGRIWIWKASSNLILQRPWFPFDTLRFAALRPIIGYGPELYGYVYALEAVPSTGLQLNAHNSIVHETVELGYLGVLSYLTVLAAAFLPAAWLAFRHRRTYTITHRLVILALLGALAGRFVEQMVGLARVGDFTLFWMVVALIVALPAALGANDEDRSSTKPALSMPGRMMPRLALASVVIVALVWMVFARNVSYLRADVAAAQAYTTGDINEAIALMDSAISLAPDKPDYYRRHADILEQQMRQSADLGHRAELAERIYADHVLAARLDPLTGESFLGQANAAVNLSRLGYEGKGQEAVQLYQDMMALVPNLVELHALLGTLTAIAYVDTGEPEKALQALDKALASVTDDSTKARALYVQGAAYYESGKLRQAIESLEQSLSLAPDQKLTAEAHFLLAQLYEEIGEMALSRQHARQYEQLAQTGEG
jgi:predicted negative regulator of RcsB-dependent stress response